MEHRLDEYLDWLDREYKATYGQFVPPPPPMPTIEELGGLE